MAFFEWFEANWATILAVFVALSAIVSAITAATPTPRDDEVWGKISLILSRIFGITTHKSSTTGKAKPKLPLVQSGKAKD